MRPETVTTSLMSIVKWLTSGIIEGTLGALSEELLELRRGMSGRRRTAALRTA